MDPIAQRYAQKLFGGIPVGSLYGMPLFESDAVPKDTLRFVETATGRTLAEVKV
jgi:hypothetical protein